MIFNHFWGSELKRKETDDRNFKVEMVLISLMYDTKPILYI